ncbi:site-specific integrase [Oceanidesulfovibrio indonesiensis]|uniref:Site-specific integrase n=1 Tax=Oceanidesulfovibrio indonesiensis TaxID=54767 RepID=A0A7M3MDJ9_9BACT|nr:site-specific integrase [Oceanidesulfovibrio indonesiensis]TVM16683.1 site-specific integrase [Oceanidesulfovibrio indonesiensis]
MPTIRKDRGNRWQGTVKIDGRIVATKLFGTGEKHGPEWRKAATWEVNTREDKLKNPTTTVSVTCSAWAIKYLDHVKARSSEKTYDEKRRAFKYLAPHVGDVPVEEIDPTTAIDFLDLLFEERGGGVANTARGNLAQAWDWGSKFIRDFPQTANPFRAVDKYPEEPQPRYVPPEDDFWTVYQESTGQDRVMLTFMYYTAARRGEVFRLTWRDVDFKENRVRLTTRKTKNSRLKESWLPIVPELRKALVWWWEHRPYQVENVFMVLDDSPHEYHVPGTPYKERSKFMKRLCKRAKVEPYFGFHAIRHRRAVDLYKQGLRLHDIQKWLRHESAATTERYLKACGLDLDQLLEAVTRTEGPAKVIPFAPKEEAPAVRAAEASV